jgi:hypothetical protein
MGCPLTCRVCSITKLVFYMIRTECIIKDRRETNAALKALRSRSDSKSSPVTPNHVSTLAVKKGRPAAPKPARDLRKNTGRKSTGYPAGRGVKNGNVGQGGNPENNSTPLETRTVLPLGKGTVSAATQLAFQRLLEIKPAD